MKLLKLLNELSAAAAEAERKGLEPMSFGRYGMDGYVTHMVKGDKLVPVAKQKDAADDPNLKPTGTSAKDAGKAPSNAVTAQDAAKTSGNEQPSDPEKENKKMDKEFGLSGAAEEPEHRSRTNPNATTIKPFGKKVDHEELRKYIPKEHDPLDFGKELVIGEEVFACTARDMDMFLWADEQLNGLPGWKAEQEIIDLESVMVQGKEWRTALPDETQAELLETQVWWQSLPQSRRPEHERTRTNAFINNVCKGPPPATLELNHPIERGMALDRGKLEEFLKAVRIGEEIETPPSGFTTSPTQARTFGEPGYNQAGVIMRIAPNHDGQLHGLALFGHRPPEEFFDSMEDPDHARAEFKSTVEGYAHEKEVIRPSGPKARVTNVRKIMEQPKADSAKPARCLYIIDMEEAGYPIDTTVTEEMVAQVPPNKVFINKMNSPFRQPKESSLTNLIPSPNETPDTSK